MPLYTATKRLLGTSLSYTKKLGVIFLKVCTWNISKPAACACMRAVDHAKFKTTKIYSQGILVDYSKFCTNENFPLYCNDSLSAVVKVTLTAVLSVSIHNSKKLGI